MMHGRKNIKFSVKMGPPLIGLNDLRRETWDLYFLNLRTSGAEHLLRLQYTLSSRAQGQLYHFTSHMSVCFCAANCCMRNLTMCYFIFR